MQNYKKYTKNASFFKKNTKKFGHVKKKQYFCIRFRSKSIFYAPSGGSQFPRLTGTLPGAIAQLVEQRTENPCVTGSIPVGTTQKKETISGLFFVPRGTRTRVLISLRSNDYCYAIFDSRWHHKKECNEALYIYYNFIIDNLTKLHLIAFLYTPKG